MEFDKLVHQETRLKIFAYLYRHGETKFNELASELDVTEGNLSSHLQTIEDADCLSVKKDFVDRKPQTTYELTDPGREKFEQHVKTLEQLLNSIEGE
jgi:DNA-binding MarR family transcriptional regulator